MTRRSNAGSGETCPPGAGDKRAAPAPGRRAASRAPSASRGARAAARRAAAIRFERAYRNAFRKHVGGAKGEGTRIGRRALALGVDTLSLARIHDRAAAAYAAPATATAPDARTPAAAAREDSFFADAVVPIEQERGGGVAALAKCQVLVARLRKRAVALAATRARLARDTARRRALEANLGAQVRRHGSLVERSRVMEARLRRLSRRLLAAQEEERLRISRDLHAAIAQTLTGINLGLSRLRNEAVADSRDLSEAITRVQQLVAQSMTSVHRFAWELRPTLLDDLGLVPALRSYSKSFAERTGVKVRVTSDRRVFPLGDDSRVALFRVAQAALSNVERHARAKHVRLAVRWVSGRTRLEVSDNGRSFDVKRTEASTANHRMGIATMRERVEMLGGKLDVTSALGRGTRVRAEVPPPETKPPKAKAPKAARRVARAALRR